MINPNRETSEYVLRRLKEASYERMRVELKCSIELLMKDFDMDWDDLAGNLKWPWNRHHTSIRFLSGEEVKRVIIDEGYYPLTLDTLNEIAHIFSTELYIIFRPREPWTKT